MLIEFGSWYVTVKILRNILSWYDKDDVIEIRDENNVSYELTKMERNETTANPILRIRVKQD